MNTKNLLTRAGAGIIYIAVLLAGILGGKYSFLIVFGTILGFGLYEFYKAMEKNTSHAISKTFNIASGIIIFLSAYLDPPLTTVNQPKYMMGKLAADLLFRLINGEKVKNNQISLKPELVIRSSCGVRV